MEGTRRTLFLTLRVHWAFALAVIVGGLAAWVAVSYAGQPLLEAHGFRQTQTALTSYWMIQEGWRLAYQTPVGGFPWSIPFEFPIFQSLVALIAWAGNFPLDPVGRLVSFFFLLACAWPALKIARRLDLPTEVAWVFCALLWSSPIYLFWGRTFMIETAAMFFVLAAIPYALDLRRAAPPRRSVLLFSLFATLAMLQKVTTAAPVLMVLAFVIVGGHFAASGLTMPSRRHIASVAFAFCVPFTLALLWTIYSDAVKQQSPFGIALTSKALAHWNFGTLEQRFSLSVLKTIFWDRVFVNNAAGLLGFALVAGAVVFGDRQIKRLVSISLILFAVPVFVFTNLHFVHDYYQTSCVLFLTGALAIATALWLPRFGRRPAIAAAATLLLIASNLNHFSAGYAKQVRSNQRSLTAGSLKLSSSATTLAVGDAIRRYTPSDSGIVVFGADWSSEIAYYSQRKSFTVPGWFKAYDLVWKAPAEYLGDKSVGAIVFCVKDGKPDPEDILRQPDVERMPRLFKIGDCYLWVPAGELLQKYGVATKPAKAVDEIVVVLR